MILCSMIIIECAIVGVCMRINYRNSFSLRAKGTAVLRLERLNSQAKNKDYIRAAFFCCFEPAPGCGTVLWNECFIFILVRLINDAHEA